MWDTLREVFGRRDRVLIVALLLYAAAYLVGVVTAIEEWAIPGTLGDLRHAVVGLVLVGAWLIWALSHDLGEARRRIDDLTDRIRALERGRRLP